MQELRDLMRQSLGLLSPGDRRKYRIAVALQMAASMLDLAGVLLFGVAGVLVASAAQGLPIPPTISEALEFVGLGGLDASQAALLMAAAAAALLIAKGIFTLVVTRRVSNFLARCAAEASAELSDKFFALPLIRIQEKTSQSAGFALSHGVTAAVIDVLSNAMIMWAEGALLIVLAVTLLVIDPLTTLLTVAFFGIVVLLLTKGLAGWSRRTGEEIAATEVSAISAVHDGVATYREVTVTGRRDFYADKFQQLRWRSAVAQADMRFISQVPRYTLEIAMVVGAILLTLLLVSTQPTQAAIGSLALFLTAATRVMPSLLRLNAARITLHAVRPRAEYAFEMEAFCDEHQRPQPLNGESAPLPAPLPSAATSSSELLADLPAGALDITASRVGVRYPKSTVDALSDVTFHLAAGESLALVGPSGAGKSTLADAILGVIDPDRGSILIGGLPASEVIRRHPGSIAYVPQEVALVSGTVRDNVALGRWPHEVDDDQVWAALRRAHLADFLASSREGLDTPVGERGVRLSGGQRQRLGIARALYSDPRLLILDEATSALDAETEHLITDTLQSIGGEVTTVTVAHRLATIREADLVLYLEDGHVVAEGSFEAVRQLVPRFNRQADLLGL